MRNKGKDSMTNEILASMSKKDILFGAQQTYQNAKKLYTSGIQLGSGGDYGLANSVLILSTEECVKCMILFAGFTGTKLDFEIAPFFKDHGVKHKEAAKMQMFINKLSFFNTEFTDVLAKRRSAFSIIVNLGISILFSSLNLGKKDTSRFSLWWTGANKTKKNGLYVGYENNSWSLPTQITEIIFNETIEMTKPFIHALEPVMQFKEKDYKLFLKGNDPERANYLPSTTPELIPLENIDFEIDQDVSKQNTME